MHTCMYVCMYVSPPHCLPLQRYTTEEMLKQTHSSCRCSQAALAFSMSKNRQRMLKNIICIITLEGNLSLGGKSTHSNLRTNSQARSVTETNFENDARVCIKSSKIFFFDDYDKDWSSSPPPPPKKKKKNLISSMRQEEKPIAWENARHTWWIYRINTELPTSFSFESYA